MSIVREIMSIVGKIISILVIRTIDSYFFRALQGGEVASILKFSY